MMGFLSDSWWEKSASLRCRLMFNRAEDLLAHLYFGLLEMTAYSFQALVFIHLIVGSMAYCTLDYR